MLIKTVKQYHSSNNQQDLDTLMFQSISTALMFNKIFSSLLHKDLNNN